MERREKHLDVGETGHLLRAGVSEYFKNHSY